METPEKTPVAPTDTATAAPPHHAFADAGLLGSLEANVAETAIAEGAPAAAAAVITKAESIAETKGMLILVLGTGFELLAPNWKVRADEVEKLSEAYAVLMEKYLPGGVGQLGPEIGALFVTVGIFSTRMGKPRTLPEKGSADAQA